ncbi:MAG: peptidase M14, partial [Thermoprotei archaeon]
LIVKVADPDGLKLNEGWLKGPFTILNYAKNYYRPAGNKQVEWTFPIQYKSLKFDEPLPETRALMKLIDRWKPDLIYSLHNAGFGGVYYYISEKAPLLYPIYNKIVEDEGLPLSLGEPEVPWAVQLSPAVYYMVSTPEYYDYLEKYSDKDPAEVIRTGTDSYDYARRVNPGVLELVTEVPYFYNPRIEDDSPTEIERRRAVLDSLQDSWKHYNYVRRVYEEVRGELRLKSRFRESIEYYLAVTPDSLRAKERWARTDPSLERPATVAEVFDNYQVSRFYRLLTLGLLYRMLKEEVRAGAGDLIKEKYEEVESKLEEEATELERELEYRVIPLDKLVRIQLAAGLYTALYVQVKNTYRRM